MMRYRLVALAVCFVCAALGVQPVGAADCAVPSVSYETIQAAADDVACTEIVLAGQIYIESADISRSVDLRGESSATTVIQGRITVTGASTTVSLDTLKVDAGALPARGCFENALLVAGGGRVTAAADVVVVNSDAEVCPVFADGFETGTTSRWTSIS